MGLVTGHTTCCPCSWPGYAHVDIPTTTPRHTHTVTALEEKAETEMEFFPRGVGGLAQKPRLQMSFSVWLGLCFQATLVLSRGMQRKTRGSSPKGRWQDALLAGSAKS